MTRSLGSPSTRLATMLAGSSTALYTAKGKLLVWRWQQSIPKSRSPANQLSWFDLGGSLLAWMTSITKDVFFLGGPSLNEWPRIEEMFKEFRSRYDMPLLTMMPHHHNQKPPSPRFCTGMRGGGRPILVISYQPIIGWRGEYRLNSKESLVCNTEQAISIPKTILAHRQELSSPISWKPS